MFCNTPVVSMLLLFTFELWGYAFVQQTSSVTSRFKADNSAHGGNVLQVLACNISLGTCLTLAPCAVSATEASVIKTHSNMGVQATGAPHDIRVQGSR